MPAARSTQKLGRPLPSRWTSTSSTNGRSRWISMSRRRPQTRTTRGGPALVRPGRGGEHRLPGLQHQPRRLAGDQLDPQPAALALAVAVQPQVAEHVVQVDRGQAERVERQRGRRLHLEEPAEPRVGHAGSASPAPRPPRRSPASPPPGRWSAGSRGSCASAGGPAYSAWLKSMLVVPQAGASARSKASRSMPSLA